MNRNYRTFSRPFRTGLTLVELLAGLVVLGTLLGGAIVARGRFLDQWGLAERRLKAAAEVEAMVSQWLAGRADAIPVPGSGLMSELPGHQWRTRWIANAAAAELSVRIVRVEVAPSTRGAAAILSVDFLIHPEPPATQPVRPASGSEVRR